MELKIHNMMYTLEILSICLIALLCFICIKSDLKVGLIYNKVLLFFVGCAVVIALVYYGIYVNDLLFYYLINNAIVALVGVYLFYSHSFAGGDCKMTIVIALLFPARYYWWLDNNGFTLMFFIAFAIFAGYCYLLISSVLKIVSKKVIITKQYVKQSIFEFVKSYCFTIVYISLFHFLILYFFDLVLNANAWIVSGLCLLIAWVVNRYSFFKNKILFVLVLCCVILISVFFRISLISMNFGDYLFVFALVLCQMTISTSIYEDIAIDDLKKGMILTTFSSMLMQKSITKGLPAVSHEDLRSRLTEGEIESIKLWAKATKVYNLTIVKKIPFAIFISIGLFFYCIMWGILI